ncbi:MAG: peptide chain release factor 1 [Oscillospiraceae bacterium]|nr:peptide chain release factor 1 [Oscillospiraceae bacterium]
MFEKLNEVEKRFELLSEKLSDPNVVNDPKEYKNIAKEYKSLDGIVSKYKQYKSALAEYDEAKELLDAGGLDPELKAIAVEQLEESKKNCDIFAEELKILLLPKDPNDDKNVVVEIRGAAGGEEAALFAGSLYRMYSMYAEAKGWKSEILNENATELGGFKEVSFLIEGEGAYSKLKYESGVHRVQRVPDTEAAGRIHTSTVTVAVLPEVEEVEFEINPADLQIDTYRSGGAGGQHVNKTESAIRITHLPTGTVVECQDERSQYKNKERAMKILRSRLYERAQAEQNEKIASERKLQVGAGDRSERIRTYNFPQSRVTDHRIGLTLYKIDAIMNGDLDEIVDALRAFDVAEKLKGESDD